MAEAHTFYANGFLVDNCQDALQYLCLGILRTTDITGAEPDPFEDSAAALRSQINGGRRYSGY